ncbi:hypothetical protein OO012_19775 [Rhodobacteraceae bacterium KMM 6894]|nr:hypothetical protein [Rhodobacteraceae bacterium KMM 6894]
MSSRENGVAGELTEIQTSAFPFPKAHGATWIVPLLLVSLVLPFIINIGPLRLSVYRIVLIIVTLPAVFGWLSGRSGRIRTADIAMLLLCIWAAVSFVVIHGTTTIQAGGIKFIETFGAYLVARVYIRTADEFRSMVKVLCLIVLFFLPFAIIEAVTGKNILLTTMDSLWNSYHRVMKDPRMGLARVQATLEHPILYGVFCGSVIALTFMVLGYGKSAFHRVGTTVLVLLSAALCLSAGPMTGMIVQVFLIFWLSVLNSVKARWKILGGLVVGAWIFLEIVADRPPAQIFISYFSFNSHSAYLRLHIWNYGTASILNHPIFGIGFNDWERPFGMSSSIDMYWIVAGVRHGFPAVFFSFLSFFAVVIPLIFRKGLDEFQAACRLGILFCLASFFLAGWTVHYWNATYVLFNFMLGSGVWLLDAQPAGKRDAIKKEARPAARYRRSNTGQLPTTRFGHQRK